MMSVPAEYQFLAISLALSGEFQAALSPSAPRYWDSISMSGATALAPAL